MTASTYPATRFLRQMTAANGWHGQLVRDRQGRADAIVAVILPTELPGTSGAVWFRDGRCIDVLAELFELQTERP
jgi:hypothetical protein